jgi:hypothetical protein
VYRSPCEVPDTLIKFQLNLNFRDRFSEISQIFNLLKIRTVDADLFHAGGQTDKYKEANNRFSKFCESAVKIIENIQCFGP